MSWWSAQLGAFGASDVYLCGSHRTVPRQTALVPRPKRAQDSVTLPVHVAPDGTATVSVPRTGADFLRHVVVRVTPEPGAEAAVERAAVLISGREVDAVTRGCMRAYDEIYGRPASRGRPASHGRPSSHAQSQYEVLRLWFSGTDRLSLFHVDPVTVHLRFSGRVASAAVTFQFTYLDSTERESLDRSGTPEEAVEVTGGVTGVAVLCGQATVDLGGFDNVKFLVLDARRADGRPADLSRIRLRANGRVQLDGEGSRWNDMEPRLAIDRPLPRGLYLIPFCTEPLDSTQFTGSVNLSRLDGPALDVYADDPYVIVDVYAREYNVFRTVKYGSSGLVFGGDKAGSRIRPAPAPAASAAWWAVRIQAAWRGYAERRRYLERLHEWYRPGGRGADAALDRLADRRPSPARPPVAGPPALNRHRVSVQPSDP